MKPRVKMHDMPGDISKQAKIAMLEGKCEEKSRTKSYKKMLKLRERATLNRQATTEISRGFDVTDPELDAPDGVVLGAYKRCGERWEPLPVGTKVSLDVVFAQKTSRMSGTLVLVKDGEAYVDTAIGPVVGSAESVEVEE